MNICYTRALYFAYPECSACDRALGKTIDPYIGFTSGFVPTIAATNCPQGRERIYIVPSATPQV